MVCFPGYKIGAFIGDTADCALFLGTKLGEQQPRPVLIKLPNTELSIATAQRRLERELDAAAGLDPTWVVRPVELLEHRGNMALILENGICHMLAKELGKPMEITRFLNLAINGAAALAEVHLHGLIHKDIKPQHILVSPESYQWKMTGFGIATRALSEYPFAQTADHLEGTLAYMSPEQTGRMNRALDYRTDFYSLGVVFYEMLTGRLPFDAADALEWVHCHIARFPRNPTDFIPGIPEPIASIVMKLIAKVAQDRYQNAITLKRDLETCLAQWKTSAQIDPFPLGRGDVSDRFQIPQKLYGREAEVANLLAAFNRVTESGVPELVLVSGYSGIGKSSLVHELQRPVASRHGYFISGKFDQVKRDVPYHTILLAFRQLVHQILAESEERVSVWKEKLQSALGGDGQVLIELIPELESLLGKQEPVVKLPPSRSELRLHRAFQNFLGSLCRPDHPLALFLDDLHWGDAASLRLLGFVLTAPKTRNFLLIGAFRDNEVSPSHPLMRELERIRTGGTRIRHISLGPLPPESTQEFIADALRSDIERTAPLACLIREKTASNPFFVIQFITTLYQNGLITFDHRHALWQWDLHRIRQQEYTDNVVDFLIAKLADLAPGTQRVMQIASCVGHDGTLSALAAFCGDSEQTTESHLWRAVCEGLILQSGERYQFLHDRVQQAAYAMMPEQRRQQVHLQIARLLLSELKKNGSALKQNAFDIANQLNFAVSLVLSDVEREEAARLNLMAGTRAQASAAYSSALTYYNAGLAFLGTNAWISAPDLAFALSFGRAQSQYLSGDSDDALAQLQAMRAYPLTNLQKGDIYRMEVDIYTLKTDLTRAVECGVAGLRIFGIELSPHPTRREVLKDYEEVWRNLGNRSIEGLANLPEMTDPGMRSAMRILEALFTGALCTDENLFLSWSSHMVNLSLRYGNCDASVTGYSYLGLALGSLFGRYREGYLFGKIAYDLVEKRGIKTYKAKVDFIFGDCINYWHRHVRKSLPALKGAFASAVEVADLPTACYCCNHKLINLLVAGEPLESVHREAELLLDFTRKAQLDASTQAIVGIDRVVQNMRGLTRSFSSFSDPDFDDSRYERMMDSYGQPIVTCWYYIMKLQARFLSGNFEAAIHAGGKARPLLWSTMGHTQESEYWYYFALALAAHYSKLPQSERGKALETLLRHQKKLNEWVANCQSNFQNKAALVDAEIARITARPLEEAAALYERSIKSARENGFIQNEAIASELAARYYHERGLEAVSRALLKEARHCYQRWGADGKVRDLGRRHPWLLLETHSGSVDTTVATLSEKLDVMTVLKAQQAISGELLVDPLVETLLRFVLENAGAQKACLFLESKGEVFSVLESAINDCPIKFSRCPSAAIEGVALSIVRYVRRTREAVILADSCVDCGDFSADEYLQQAKPKSVLCMPVVRQTRLSGILYLENNLVSNAFTPDRRAVLEVLASQAAISIETALLYSDLERAKDEQQNQADLLRLILDGIGEGVVVVNEHAEVVRTNPMAEQILGTGIATVPQEQWSRHYGYYLSDQKTPYPCDQLPLFQAIRGKPVDGVEIYMRRPDMAHGRWLSVTARPLIEKDGTGRGAVAVFSDVTARTEAMAGEREAKESAEAANRTKDLFLAMLSHELRTPLTPVLNGINLLAASADPESTALLEIMRRNLLLETRLIDELLDLTQIAKGKLSVNLEPVDANTCVRETVEGCRSELEERRVTLRLETAEDTVNADPGRLQQVIRNLLQNAIRFTDVRGSIEVRTWNPDSGVLRITCKDDGVGIAPGELSRIFEPFEQSSRVVRHGYGGLGLGLAICKALVEAQGGTICVHSAGPGTGATFEINLPTIPKREPAAPRTDPGVPAETEKVPASQFSILLVEDHSDTRRTWERLLARSGYSIVSADSCSNAIDQARRHKFNLIICDIGLPDGNGYDLIQALHEVQSCPAISLSGFGMATDFQRSRSAGFVDHLVKPIEIKQLKADIVRWTGSSHAAALH